MKKGIIGKKLGMTQIFTEDGQRYPGNCDRSRSLLRYTEEDNRD